MCKLRGALVVSHAEPANKQTQAGSVGAPKHGCTERKSTMLAEQFGDSDGAIAGGRTPVACPSLLLRAFYDNFIYI
tara:strand:+ start:378 stop:605 length:228 start_codon:yes stop_codon:yes gene_type:complete